MDRPVQSREDPEMPLPLLPSRRKLSEREREVVALLVQGKSQKEVAAILGISVKTVETHRTHIFSKLRLHNQQELCRYIQRAGAQP